jgi:hypothetical protein
MRKLILALALFGCSSTQQPGPLVPSELICKLNVLANLPRRPEDIDYLAIEAMVRDVRGCTIVHLPDAGQ